MLDSVPVLATSDQVLIEFPTQLSILVVEDDFGDYDAVARALRKIESFKATVVRAKTLEAARKAVSETQFDVFLIDYNLGNESGARFLHEIGGRGGSGIPILLTGIIDRDVQEIALRAGAISCINKADLSPTMLETTIRCALYTHRLEAEVSQLLTTVVASMGDSPAAIEGLNAFARRMPWLARARAKSVAIAAP